MGVGHMARTCQRLERGDSRHRRRHLQSVCNKKNGGNERWDAELIKAIQGTPQQPDPGKIGIGIPIGFRFEVKPTEVDVQPVREMTEPMARRRGITQTELDKYGFTEGCPGCIAKQRGEVAKKGHSEACRKRIEDMMRQNDEDKKKIEAADDRISHQIARKLEQEEKKRKTAEEDADQRKDAMQDGEMRERTLIVCP